MAQLHHLSRHLATVLLHLNRIFIELFIEMNNCLYCCMHCVMMFCNKAGAGPCKCMQPDGSCCIEIERKKEKIPAMDFVAYYSWHALLKRWSKWAGADNSERDRSLWLWFMTVWVGVQTIVESVRSFPGWYCSTVWTTVSSQQGLVVGFGRVVVCLSFSSFTLSPTFSHPRKLCPKQRVCYEKCLYSSYSSYILEHVLFWLTVIVTFLSLCRRPDSSDPLYPTALALHPRLC